MRRAPRQVWGSEGEKASGDQGRVAVAVLVRGTLCPVGLAQLPSLARTSLALTRPYLLALATWAHAGAGLVLTPCILNMA